MIKRFICWLFGHTVPWRWDYSDSDGKYVISRADFCSRCGKLEEEFMEERK